MHASRHTLIALAIASVAVVTSGCTGSSPSTDPVATTVAPTEKVTITFWHGWSQPSEVKAIADNIAAFQKLHPNITVKTVPNVADDKILQGIRGGNGPDVVSSFTTDNVGMFCNGALMDLNPWLAKSGVDKNSVFLKPMVEYTQYQGKQCTLPLLGDAYGMYYNKAMFAAAGISAPPRTWSEFKADAVKLTKQSGASYSQLGFMPTFHGYENAIAHWVSQSGPTYFSADGKANIDKDPAFADFLTMQKDLVDSLGGFARLEKYRNGFGEEFSPQNAFEAGKVAMQIDGEWRTVSIRDDGVKLDWATAPLPVPDDQAASYGRGYVSGTVVGIPANSKHAAAAWEFVKYLTTDTTALVTFANAIHNVPSTHAAMSSPDLDKDAQFATFLQIAQNEQSNTTPASPNGGQYQTILQDFTYKWESGQAKDLTSGLADVDQQIDKANAQAKG
ncbi:ABC transporter substrate-binding protein [Pedococcus bigeumensis]|uniref:ABC transporter substrate-binding protein n=1 Tax=Pedococcus bigeumensis TaxID=433644 RepID=A0A502CRB6_9MICO|nr:ABC transporter substrate-binding protein [Pedococcus bigeumensis]TPG15060.1 ABC transporter substrate-binding protein [Pedococcus bigeumensis]